MTRETVTVRLTKDTWEHIIYAKATAEKRFMEDLTIDDVVHSVFLHIENQDKNGSDIVPFFERHGVTKLHRK